MVTDLLAGVVALTLLVALVAGTVIFVRAAFFRRDVVVVSPFVVTGNDDPDGRLGRSLAIMLHGRVRQLEREFETSQRDLATPAVRAPGPGLDTRALLAPSTDLRPITMSTISPGVHLDLKVAGIQLGGVAAWLERAALRRRALTFAVHFGDDEALVNADLTARPELGVPDLWLRTGPEPGDVVTALAYALLQGRMVQAGVTAVGALELDEFRVLLTSLSTLGDLNRRIASGRARSTADYGRVYDALRPVLDEVPEWVELLQLLAQLAERTDEPGRAATLYERLRRLDRARPRLEPEQRADLDRKVETLRAVEQPALDAREREFTDAVRTYQRQLGLDPPYPDVGLMREPPQIAGLQSLWKPDEGRYEVNPDVAADPAREMVRLSALMGRFMDRHFARCTPTVDPDFWNSFRYSVVQFVVETEPGTTFSVTGPHPLLRVLRRIGDAAGVQPARGLALALLDRFDCDWNPVNLPDRAAAIAADAGLPDDVVRRAFAIDPP